MERFGLERSADFCNMFSFDLIFLSFLQKFLFVENKSGNTPILLGLRFVEIKVSYHLKLREHSLMLLWELNIILANHMNYRIKSIS